MATCTMLAFFAAAVFGVADASAKEKPQARFRVVEGRLEKPNGSPAAGTRVWLYGIDRYARMPMDDGADEIQDNDAWRFTTDKQGRFHSRFGEFKTTNSKRLTGQFMPGWGVYYFVAEVEGVGRAISARIVNTPTSGDGKVPDDGRFDRVMSRSIELAGDPAKIAMTLERGLTVEGRVVDPAGDPVPGFAVDLWHDLGVGTHTGYGGEIFRMRDSTDANGRFTFEGVYPNTFHLGPLPTEEADHVWLRTRIRARWVDEIVDVITPRKNESIVPIVLVVAKEAPFRYCGRIIDEGGVPIAGANIVVGVSRHREARTFADNHTFCYATTGADGQYELQLASPFVRFFRASSSGRETRELDFEDAFAGPGNYDFMLPRTDVSEK